MLSQNISKAELHKYNNYKELNMEDLNFKDKLCKLYENILALCPSIGRFLIKVFGIKFKYRDRIYLSKYWKAKENNENITTLPKIDGLVRKVQLTNLVILKEFDYICRKNGLNYWLVFGTQLGATRHHGYIPWDDDIDVGMLRDDYNKFIEIFDNETRNKDLYIKIIKNKHTPGMLILKIKHKHLSFAFIDIFTFEYVNHSYTEEQRKEKNQKIIELRNNINKQKSLLKLSTSELQKHIQKLFDDNILENSYSKEDKNPDIALGIDFPHGDPIRLFSYETIFPLKDVIFEDLTLKQVNNPELLLESEYGKNYMDYPPQISLGHISNQIITQKEQKIMDELIKTLYN